MAERDPDLEELTTLLGQCLGRIDEQAYRLQRSGDDGEEADDAGDVLEQEAARLQELVSSMLAATDPREIDQADLDRTVERAVQGCLRELGFPLVVRLQLAGSLPPVACKPGQLAYAVQRALLLGTSHAGSGGEIAIATRAGGEDVVFELAAIGNGGDRHLAERVTTLQEFVQDLSGRCRTHASGHQLSIVFELPCCMLPNDR
ncbi:MAG: hypothetical protein IPK26_19120 [Planctomycetes bacterium]|nr:hypothetical protein [Planctomycetota bacterium]